jgi:tetratricopeptide (TPR) repeat protein
MKRALLTLGVVFLLSFAALTALKRAGREDAAAEGGMDAAEKERIRAFWEAFNAATAARSRGDFPAAAGFYRQALELSPEHEESLFYLAASLEEQGRYSEAVATLRRLTEINPASNRAHSQLGNLLATLAPGGTPDFDAAAAAFSRNKEINYEESGPFLRLGLLELARGNPAKAREDFSLAAGGGGPEGMFLLALTDYLEGHYSAASKGWVRVLAANEREKAVSGRGVFSEGDIRSSAGEARLSAFERAGIKSLLFLYWTSRRGGGYSAEVPDRFRLRPSGHGGKRFERAQLPGALPGRALWLDFDNDRRPDLLIVGPRGVSLIRNGPGGWQDLTREAGLAGARGAWDAALIDENGDGWQDLYLVRAGYMGVGSNSFYRNDHGRFLDVTAERGLAGERATSRALAVDLNGDGRLDLIEVGSAGATDPSLRVFLNQKDRFVESSAALGLVYPATAVDAVAEDFDGDGQTDLFVLGWRFPARLYRQTASGFADVTATAGLENAGGEGLSALRFDFDRDSLPDLLVTAQAPLELSLMRLLDRSITSGRHTPRLFRNRGGGRFEEATASIGLNRCYGVMQAVSADFDRDGWPDLLFAHGGLEKSRLEPSPILRNVEGKSFVEWTYLPGFDEPLNASGAAIADADGDGWADVYLFEAGLFRNRGK